MSKHRVRAELHTHSTFSDGSFDPEELAVRLCDAGVSFWSLTDHDTCRGCARAAVAAAEHGLTFIPGIEISAWHGRSIHVLGYGLDPDRMVNYETRRLGAREARMKAMVDRLDGLGVPLAYGSVLKAAGGAVSLARPHLAAAMVAAGHVESISEAFDQYLAEGKPAYIESEWPPVEEAIEIIHQAGGVAILAHPGQYPAVAAEALDAWVEAGLDGVECRHPRHSRKVSAMFEARADAAGILKTASSDYHGPGRYAEPGTVLLDPEWLDALNNAIGAK